MRNHHLLCPQDFKLYEDHAKLAVRRGMGAAYRDYSTPTAGKK